MHISRKTAALVRAAQFLLSGLDKETTLEQLSTDTLNYTAEEMHEITGWVNHESFTKDWKKGDETPTINVDQPGSIGKNEYSSRIEALKNQNSQPVPEGVSLKDAITVSKEVKAELNAIDMQNPLAGELKTELVTFAEKVDAYINKLQTPKATNKIGDFPITGPGNPPQEGTNGEETPAAGNGPSLTTDHWGVIKKLDYKNLTNKAFKKYAEIVGDDTFAELDEESGLMQPVNSVLNKTEVFRFGLFKVDVIRKDRFPGMKDTPKDFVGIKVKSDAPETVTRIPLSVALEMNRQITNQHSLSGHGKYYLLMK